MDRAPRKRSASSTGEKKSKRARKGGIKSVGTFADEDEGEKDGEKVDESDEFDGIHWEGARSVTPLRRPALVFLEYLQIYLFLPFVIEVVGEGADPGQEDLHISVKEEDVKASRVAVDEEKKQKKRKSKPVAPRLTKEQREFAKHVHEAHLLALTASGLLMSERCDDTLIRALILSLLPEVHMKKVKAIKSHEEFVAFMEALLVWWHGTFQIVDETVCHSHPPLKITLVRARK